VEASDWWGFDRIYACLIFERTRPVAEALLQKYRFAEIGGTGWDVAKRLEDIGIQRTAAQFGFKTTWGHNLSLDQIIAIANRGKPVIVSWPPDRWDGGHLLVLTGGNNRIVKLADSSVWNFTSLSRAQFLHYWEGYYAIVTPA